MNHYTLDRPTALTCPECGGAVAPQFSGTLLQFRCHIGHLLSAETMLAAKTIELESCLATCLVRLNERAELCREMAAGVANDAAYVAALEKAEKQAIERAKELRRLLEADWVQPLQVHEKA